MVVPARVSAGDTVAIVSPAAGAVGSHPHRAERAQRYLEALGLRVRFMPNARRADGWASAPARHRADDIHAAFADPEITVVLAGIGGNHSNQVVPLLDWDLIRANPKIFQGYSDISVLHWALARNAGLRTFYGPALIPELGEWPAPLSDTAASLEAAWFGEMPLALAPARAWTEERIDWRTEDRDAPRARTMQPSDGRHWLRGGAAAGWLFGGCLETICWHLKGSQSWLDLDGAVLFLETSEEAPSPAHVDAYLTDLEQLGVLRSRRGTARRSPGRLHPRRRGGVRDRVADPHRGGRHPGGRERRLRAHRPDADAPVRRVAGGRRREWPTCLRGARNRPLGRLLRGGCARRAPPQRTAAR